MAGITLKNITRQWTDCVAVDNLSLEIPDKEFLVLLGPSGCGKTTTMRMVAGLETPTSGEIFIGDALVNDVLPRNRDIAMVFQNYGLYPHMSVFDNIAYPLKVRGVEKNSIGTKVEQAAKQVELLHLLDRKPKALSGGQRQRVALARAIVRTPKAFLMDEPLSNLDAKLRVSMRAELKHLSHQLRITTVYVTHDQIEAMTLADRVAVMHEGRIQQLGTPDEIYNNPRNVFVAEFIGSPAMNLLHGALVNGTFVLDGVGKLIAVGKGNNARVLLGIRAEDIAIVASGKGDADTIVYSGENTGESVLLTLQLGGQRITARDDRQREIRIDEQLAISFNKQRLYLFDANSGERIHF